MQPNTMPKPFYIPRDQNRDIPIRTPFWQESIEAAIVRRRARNRAFNRGLTRLLVPVLLAVVAWALWTVYVQG